MWHRDLNAVDGVLVDHQQVGMVARAPDGHALKKSKNRENCQKKGENFKILSSSESKKFKFYILDIRYEKKFGGYFLKKTPFSTF